MRYLATVGRIVNLDSASYIYYNENSFCEIIQFNKPEQATVFFKICVAGSPISAAADDVIDASVGQ